ncbi:LysR family transcriptional regulator [Paenibacillus glycinis]|uniref:LysR family transcriptional regulator n=1 Tax=Paenibacillus glycinis TaxID=2697035 RepID=A0ABW9XXN0_9BACL|nr:LysR family transcriptional regulator [Paenibacillus glycinis]NBD27472.1 LysR family transcriptional regulator [Paenibacillus glycinis]
MDIRHLNYFLEVARRQSFTKAAQALYITQPTISKTIKNFEDELGVVLFERAGKRILLTDAGEILLEQAQQMMQAFKDMTFRLEELTEVRAGRIRVGLPPMVGVSFFPQVIGRFRASYPGIALELFEYGTKRVAAEVESGELDIGVILLPADEERFDSFCFVKQQLMLVVPPSHRLAGREEVRLAELSEEPFLLFHEDFALRDRIIAACERQGFRPHVVYSSTQWDFISELAAVNLGIALLPDKICKELDRERLRIIRTDPPIPWELAMIWRKNGYLSHAAREWIALARTMLAAAD